VTVGPASSPATVGLPVHTLVLARRVRVLVLSIAVLAVATAVAGWVDGGGVGLPGVAGLGAHLAVQAAVVVPVWWQFAGDPVLRQRRAVRAMTVAFAVLAVIALIDAGRALAGPHGPARDAVGLGLAVVALVAVPVLVAAEARAERRFDARPAAAPASGSGRAPALVGAEALLLAGIGGHLLLGPGPALAATWLVAAAVAATWAAGAWRGDGVPAPPAGGRR